MLKTEIILDEVIKWIDSNLDKPLRIDDVAARAGYSKWHLQRIFTSVKKQTWVNISEARKFLLPLKIS